ncbi:MAG: hypothetical protein GY703_20120 [Gammaproteobacteria bacterium]|nr:hypothetical protein [Gammaproteobacteria bacterium]
MKPSKTPAKRQVMEKGPDSGRTPAVSKSGCMALGPLKGRQQAFSIARSFKSYTSSVPLKETKGVVVPTNYVVLDRKDGNSPDLREIKRRIRANGVSDWAQIRTGPYKDRISFGLYHTKAYARKREAQIAAMNIPAVTLPQLKSGSRFWVVLDPADPAIAGGAGDGPSVVSTGKVCWKPCESLASSK